jgi:fluoroacetyl-CoA thioesterase
LDFRISSKIIFRNWVIDYFSIHLFNFDFYFNSTFVIQEKQKLMVNKFQTGDKKFFSHTVQEADAATFSSGNVHPVYSTFTLARDAEWCCRLFVLEMKENDEEGIGTFIHVNHQSPALIGQQVDFIATIKSIEKNSIVCFFEAKVGDRIIANGEQGQKILKKERVKSLFENL